MLKYLVVLLDDLSTSYCHYENNHSESKLISLDDLKEGIFFAMKENLSVQFVYPDDVLPDTYRQLIDTIDHSDVVSSQCQDEVLRKQADIIVFSEWDEITRYSFDKRTVCVLRTAKKDLFDNYSSLKDILNQTTRVNIVITDVDTFTDADFDTYKRVLSELADDVYGLYKEGKEPQLNILTDRLILNTMNNCNAGFENITLAPDGKFYVCPAFYCAGDEEDFGIGKSKVNVGNVTSGIDIKNPQLYKLDHAPICRKCDAFQCKRCVWLNRKTTYEVNTPSREQCITAHLERNASRELLMRIRALNRYVINNDIKEIDYLDPFEVLSRI